MQMESLAVIQDILQHLYVKETDSYKREDLKIALENLEEHKRYLQNISTRLSTASFKSINI